MTDTLKKLLAAMFPDKEEKEPMKEEMGEPKDPMEAIKKEMSEEEDKETPEDESKESREYQALEDKLGVEKHKPGKLFGGKHHALIMMIKKK